jgi:hypothetical protein
LVGLRDERPLRWIEVIDGRPAANGATAWRQRGDSGGWCRVQWQWQWKRGQGGWGGDPMRWSRRAGGWRSRINGPRAGRHATHDIAFLEVLGFAWRDKAQLVPGAGSRGCGMRPGQLWAGRGLGPSRRGGAPRARCRPCLLPLVRASRCQVVPPLRGPDGAQAHVDALARSAARCACACCGAVPFGKTLVGN